MRPRGASGEEVLAVTHLELEAVVKTVQSFLRELTGKVMRFEQLEALADEVVILPRRGGGRPSTLRGRGWYIRGCKVKVHRPVDKARYTGTVGDTGADGLTRVAYEDEDKEDLDMSKEKFEVIPAAVQQTQGAALGSNTVDNSRPKTRAFMNISEAEGKGRDHQEDLDMSKDKYEVIPAAVQQFCEAEGREWLPAAEATVQAADAAATELLRACAYVVFAFVIFGRPDTGVSMRQEHIGITAPGSELRGAVQLLEAAVGVGEAPVSTS
ncbi:hypothetical protein CYMTET_45413 [Cymbomonas tetramitiformis]|uniref:Uncharacterized protein n=1 Tax=Cymbomonas tetramitiformis TaxID=36881 RepID=A0AAE0BY97_9CHLO|nr:hypothetical protein CYMTET_45413 [Cymbomonas tetramitiformis]